MDDARQKKLESILDKVLDVLPEDRQSVIEESCRDDTAALEFVNRMLAIEACANASSFLTSPLPAPNDLLWLDVAVGTAGTAFGPYVLVRLLGQGGMGEVHLAERRDGVYEQHVALKLIPLPTPNLMQRFRRERQILAGLAHPNIARLLDGGIGTNSVPYFAMEYVDGVPITTYCREHQLDVLQILALFEDVCSAVQFAHRNLVVHRDIKPSNILVTHDGVPKLLDFGIAKVLDSSDGQENTQTVARAFTPDYAAPEQMRGASVSTLTDVYSLGVVLYELLAGVKPFAFTKQDSLDRMVGKHDPPPPSVAVAKPFQARRKQLRGDIDRIALTAIATEPNRRYGSVEALANDIRSHLEGRPISVRAGATLYRLQKFVNRNRSLAIIASLLLFTLVFASIAILWQAHRVSREADKTTAVNGFLRSVFSVADPDVSKGDSISATEMLDRSATRLNSLFANEPELKTDLQHTLGGLYLSLGEYARARDLFDQSLTLQQRSDGIGGATFANALVDLASANIALDQYASAEVQLRQALDILSAAYGSNSPQISKATRLLGECHSTLGRSAEAEPLLRKALVIDQNRGSGVDVSEDLAALGGYTFRIHRFKESKDFYRRAVAGFSENLGTANSKTVLAQSNLADATFYAGDIGSALTISREAVATGKKLFGQDHPVSLRLQRKLIMLLAANSFYDEAEPLVSDLLIRTRAVMGPRHSDVAEALLTLVEYDFGRGHYADALTAANEANGIWREVLGEQNQRLEEGLKDVAACEQALGQFDNAIRDLNSALELSRALAGKETITYADLEQTLGKVYIQKGDAAAAEPYCSDAERIAHKIAGVEDPLTAEAQFCLAAETSRRDNRIAAVALWKEALDTARHAYVDAPLQQERFTYPLGKALTAAGDQTTALAVLNDDMQMRKSQFGEGSVSYANAQAIRGVVLERLGRKTEAAQELRQAIDSCKSHPDVSLRDCLPKIPLFYEDCKAVFDGKDCAPQ